MYFSDLNTALLLSAPVVGFMGSLHCVGMCGPIALMLPEGPSGRIYFFTGRLLYNAGRTVTYAGMGLAAGLIGGLFSISGFQSELSIAAGILIILSVLFLSEHRFMRLFPSVVTTFNLSLKRKFSKWMGRKGIVSLFIIGMLNGLLPCGFVYLALAGAVAAGSAVQGAAYMALFGAGTIPAMLAVSWAGRLFGLRFRSFFLKAAPVIAIALALLLIHRGGVLKTGKAACCPKTESVCH